MRIFCPLCSLAIIVASLLLSGCGNTRRSDSVETNPAEVATAVKSESQEDILHERMVMILKEIDSRKQFENIYLGAGPLGLLKSKLETLPANAQVAERFQLTLEIGQQELRIGNTQEAIDHFLAAYRLSSKIPSKTEEGSSEDYMLYQLGLAYLRLGETSNCVHCQTGESCIIPIRGDGVHTDRKGSQEAIKYFTTFLEHNTKDFLESQPTELAACWLLNLAYMTVGGYPDQVPEQFLIPPQSFESDEEFSRFTDIAGKLGINTLSLSGGAIADDFDDDGFLDIVVSGWDPGEQLRYFHNDGNGKFTERTEQAGLLGITGGLNLVQTDYDNDGDIDIFVLRGAWLEKRGQHPNSLLRNDGHGYFRDVTLKSGLADVSFPTQTASWADYDNDGDLDVYIGNEEVPCQLFKNQGDGTFVDVAESAGVTNGPYTKGVIWGDYDGDRYPDLYVSNFETPNHLYHNKRDGSFEEVAGKLGVTRPIASFPAWFWDFDNDGKLDLYVSSFKTGVEYVAADYLRRPHHSELACLYQGDGQGGFKDVAVEQNLVRVTQTMGANFGDLDNDGFLDFYLGTGYPQYDGLMPNVMYRNRGGTGFSDVSTAGGFSHLQKGHGIAFGDLDNDGDQDVFAELGGGYSGDAFRNALFENPGFGNHWIKIKLIGKKSNRAGVGARIKIDIGEDGKSRSIYKWVNSGGSFGCNPLRQEIGLGKAASIARLEVYWPTSDTTQRFENIAADQFIEITEFEDTVNQRILKTISFQ